LAPASSKYRHEQDAFLVTGARVAVERFEPEGDQKHPVVLLLHGIDGLWDRGDAYRLSAGRLAQKGFVVLLPHYFDRTGTLQADVPRLMSQFQGYLSAKDDRPEHWRPIQEPFEAWLEVVRGAIQYARSRGNVESDRIGLIGVSLGGYLALSAGSEEDLHIQAVVDYFGGLPRHIGTSMRTMPPTLLLHGDHDHVVPLREAQTVHDLLMGRKLPCEIKVYPGIGHVFADDQGRMSWRDTQAFLDAETRTANFLTKYLGPTDAEPGS
jgi:carboxymethylenebutenolidase